MAAARPILGAVRAAATHQPICSLRQLRGATSSAPARPFGAPADLSRPASAPPPPLGGRRLAQARPPCVLAARAPAPTRSLRSSAPLDRDLWTLIETRPQWWRFDRLVQSPGFQRYFHATDTGW